MLPFSIPFSHFSDCLKWTLGKPGCCISFLLFNKERNVSPGIQVQRPKQILPCTFRMSPFSEQWLKRRLRNSFRSYTGNDSWCWGSCVIRSVKHTHIRTATCVSNSVVSRFGGQQKNAPISIPYTGPDHFRENVPWHAVVWSRQRHLNKAALSPLVRSLEMYIFFDVCWSSSLQGRDATRNSKFGSFQQTVQFIFFKAVHAQTSKLTNTRTAGVCAAETSLHREAKFKVLMSSGDRSFQKKVRGIFVGTSFCVPRHL